MIGRRHLTEMLIAAGIAVVGILTAQERTAPTPAAGAIAETRAAAPGATFRFTDPDGKPLPFQSEEELLVFLRTAEVKSQKHLSTGVTVPTKVLLEKDGVRADAVFKDVNEDRSTPTFGGGRDDLYFRDSYIYEPAAYQLSLLLGLDNVPPTTLRKLDRANGSIQIWIEHATNGGTLMKEKVAPPDPQRWNKQLQMMNVFDALIYNTDRNSGNFMITPDWKLWMIDHTRAFRRHPVLQKPDSINQCERGMYQKLKALDEAVVRERLKEYLSVFELDALLTRRTLLLERIDKLIAERGEAKVLYDYKDPAPSPPPVPTPPANPQ
jgi:hypothetical protein